MVPTQAAPISAAVQLNAPVTTRLPSRPGWPMRLAAGTRTASKCTRGVTTPRWPILSYTSITLMPGAEPGTAITASASSAPAAGSVRQTTVYSSHPVRPHPVPLVV